MRRFLTTVALTCALSVSALAGEMPTCGAPAPATPSNVAGEIPSVPAPESPDTESSAVLSALLTIIGLAVS